MTSDAEPQRELQNIGQTAAGARRHRRRHGLPRRERRPPPRCRRVARPRRRVCDSAAGSWDRTRATPWACSGRTDPSGRVGRSVHGWPVPPSCRFPRRCGCATPRRTRCRSARSSTVSAARLTVAHPRYLSAVPDDRVLKWEMPPPAVSELPDDVDGALDDTAMIMCTSGSTSAPKGIRLTNATMLARTVGRRSFGLRALSWLPLYHAGGHARALLGRLRSGSEYHLMLAEAFARDPGSWFRKATELEAQLIGGASSAFAAAVARDRPPSRRHRPLERAVHALLARDGRSRCARPVGRGVRSAGPSVRDVFLGLRPVRGGRHHDAAGTRESASTPSISRSSSPPAVRCPPTGHVPRSASRRAAAARHRPSS